jgi:hypothetical protein
VNHEAATPHSSNDSVRTAVALNGQVAGFEKNGKVIFALEASSSLDMISEEKPEELKEICTLRKAV